MSKADGKKIAIKFTEPLVGDVSGNQLAFTVSGKEYKWVDGPNHNGPFINKEYEVASVESHPTEENSILLTMKNLNEFNNTVGDLTVSYDMIKGNLTGSGGFVESFEEIFTPNDLIARPNPGIHDHVSVAPAEITAELKDIVELQAYTKEYISIAPVEVTAELIDAEIVNP